VIVPLILRSRNISHGHAVLTKKYFGNTQSKIRYGAVGFLSSFAVGLCRVCCREFNRCGFAWPSVVAILGNRQAIHLSLAFLATIGHIPMYLNENGGPKLPKRQQDL